MRNVVYSSKYKKDYKAIISNSRFNETELNRCIDNLLNGKNLDKKYKNHKMLNKRLYLNSNSFHLANDIIVLYKLTDDSLNLIRIGNHSKILGKERCHGAPGKW